MEAIYEISENELKEFLKKHAITSNDNESESLINYMKKDHIRFRFNGKPYYVKKFCWSYRQADFRIRERLRDNTLFQV